MSSKRLPEAFKKAMDVLTISSLGCERHVTCNLFGARAHAQKRPASKLGQTAYWETHRHPGERALDSSTCILRRLIFLLVLIAEMATEETKLLGEALSTVKIQVQQMKRHLVCLPIGTINTSARATAQR